MHILLVLLYGIAIAVPVAVVLAAMANVVTVLAVLLAGCAVMVSAAQQAKFVPMVLAVIPV